MAACRRRYGRRSRTRSKTIGMAAEMATRVRARRKSVNTNKCASLTHPDTWRRRRWQSPFIEALRNSANVRYACERVSITRQSAYEYRDRHPKFAKQWDDAIEDAVDVLEAEAWRRSMEGTLRPIFYKGTQCGAVKEYSDGLHALLLKAHRPKKFGERLGISDADGNTLPVRVREVLIELPAEREAEDHGNGAESLEP